jgi:hypothetical protein
MKKYKPLSEIVLPFSLRISCPFAKTTDPNISQRNVPIGTKPR